MKIFTLADLASNWYPRQAFSQFQHYSDIQFVSLPHQADLIWIMSYYLTPTPLLALPPAIYKFLPLTVRRKRALTNKPIITTIAHLTPAKQSIWQPTIRLLDKLTDHWQTFSLINLPYFKKFITKPIHVLPYWIDTKQFYPLLPQQRQELIAKFKLPRNKTFIGSFQRDTEQDLVTPKLEKGPDIFCDILERLDRHKIFVVLTGPRRQYVEHRLATKSIPYQSFGHVPYQTMNELYNTLDYYLVTSRYEGGPQAILEAMATKTKIFSTYVGVADLLDQKVIFYTAEQCAASLSQSYPDVLEEHYRRVMSFQCQNVIPHYEQFFKKIAKEHAAAHPVFI